jgi:hypothetical protein
MSAIYTRLEDFLSTQKWKKADLETKALLLKITNREKEEYLRDVDIDDYELPPEDLKTIDDLWVNYSQGRFGFSIQKRKFFEANCDKKWKAGKWINYCISVGWYKRGLSGNFIGENDIIYNLSAPEGHLPWIWLYRNFWASNQQTTVTYPALMYRVDLKIR